MKTKRIFHKENIFNFHKKMEDHKTEEVNMTSKNLPKMINLPSSSAEEINAAFSTVIIPKKRSNDELYKISKKRKTQNEMKNILYILLRIKQAYRKRFSC